MAFNCDVFIKVGNGNERRFRSTVSSEGLVELLSIEDFKIRKGIKCQNRIIFVI